MNSGGFLYAVCSSVCAGLTLGFWGAGFLAALTCVVGALLSMLIGRKSVHALMLAGVLAAAGLGIVRADIFLYAEASQTLPNFLGSTALVTGRIADDPDRRDTSLHVSLSVEEVNGEAASGTLLVLLPREEELVYGERIRVRGLIEAPQAFETNGGRLFDYPGYLRAQGISAVMRYAQLRSLERAGFSLRGTLFSLKHSFERSLERTFAEPQGSLLEGLLLGEKHGLPKELTDAFIRSGLIHVVVLSGYNIAIVASAIFHLLSFLPLAFSSVFGGASILLFALMTGGGAATVRACVMALIAVLARYLDRPTAALRALALAAVGMALWNPPALLYDTGFILSVLATFGLITLSPHFEKRLAFLPERLDLRSIAASTLSVQLFVLPALLYFTGVLSAVSLPANILALPVVAFAMFFGFFGTVINFANFYLAFPLAFIADLLLRWMLLVAQTAAALPWGAGIVPAFPAWLAALAYVPLTWLALRLYKKHALAEKSAARFKKAASPPRSASPAPTS